MCEARKTRERLWCQVVRARVAKRARCAIGTPLQEDDIVSRRLGAGGDETEKGRRLAAARTAYEEHASSDGGRCGSRVQVV